MTPAMHIALSLSALFALVGVAMWLYHGRKRMAEAEARKLDDACRPTPFLPEAGRERFLRESYARRRTRIENGPEYLDAMRRHNAEWRAIYRIRRAARRERVKGRS